MNKQASALHDSSPVRHLALILDGNGRWAQKRNLPITAGHRAGAETLRQIVKDVIALGIPYLTVYAFSTENWRRSSIEVRGMMQIFRSTMKKYFKDLAEENICIRVLGDVAAFPKDIQKSIQEAVEKTKDNTALTLSIALSYGGRAEIIQAVQKVTQDCLSEEKMPEDVTPELFSSYLYTKDLPDPDLLIRPGGEVRLSNFLLWQLSYTEFIFLDTLWPDFNREALEKCLQTYQMRQRRFGRRILLEEEKKYVKNLEEEAGLEVPRPDL